MKHVLVSGGTGVTGAALVRCLLDRNIAVTALSRPHSPRRGHLPEHPLLRVVECDLNDFPAAARSVPQRPDAFFHLAWDGSRGIEKVNNRDNMELQAGNIMHALGAVELCRATGCPLFLETGTQAEYGRLHEPAREDLPCDPENGYGAAKLCANRMTRIRCHNYGIRHIWARLFSVYGPFDGTESLVDKSIGALLSGESPAYTKGAQRWDFLYSYDAARALILLAEKGRDGEIYNVASGESRPLAEFIKIMHQVVNPGISPRLGAKPYAAAQIMHMEADTGKLRRETGFMPEFTFAQGIEEIRKWHLKKN